MKDVRVIFSSDFHLGLKTDDIDRTPEIISVLKSLVLKCKKIQDEGKQKVILVLGGDIFNTNYPSEALITEFFTVLNLIRKYEIDTYIMVGNHDSVPDPDRLSCLSFVRKVKVAYPTIKLIDDIKFIQIDMHDAGPVYFTFLPHVTRALIHKKIEEGKYKGELNTKKYIEKKTNRILKKIGKGDVNHYVFSHLNVIGAHPGSEENLLKKSEVYLPTNYLTPPMGYMKPTIIQAHIHSHSVQDNINIVGSPIFCTFGESGPKYYCDITINSCLGYKDIIEFKETDCRPFLQLEIDMIGETGDFFKLKQVADFMKQVKSSKKPVVKFDITIDPEHNTYDWKAVRQQVMGTEGVYVKNIIPRVVVKRKVRLAELKLDQPVKEKVKTYLKKSIKDKPRAKRIYKRTQKYLGE